MKNIILSFVLIFSASLQAQELKLTAFNVGLAHGFVEYAKERLPGIVEEIKKADADFYCLSEVWEKKDRKKLIKALEKQYPYTHMTPIEQTYSRQRPTCKIGDLFGEGKFATCTLKECKGLDDSEFTQCVTTKCGPALRALQGDKRQCAQALMAQVGNSTIRSLIRVLNPLRRANLFAYGGGNGLMVFSKKPIVDVGLVDLSDISTLNRRGALYTQLIDDQKESHHIYCAHLGANLTHVAPYPGNFQNWEEENRAQVERLTDVADHGQEPTYIMGDTNCSFDLPQADIRPDFEGACLSFLNKGFENFYLEQNPECTYCSTNTIIANNPNEEGRLLIDHIFTKNVPFSVITREFDELIEIKVKGEKLMSHPSDHYGVSIQVNAL